MIQLLILISGKAPVVKPVHLREISGDLYRVAEMHTIPVYKVLCVDDTVHYIASDCRLSDDLFCFEIKKAKIMHGYKPPSH